MKRMCFYCRVSTQKQGRSGLGLEAQQSICMQYINSINGEFVKEFRDVESGRSRSRQGLLDAIAFCKDNDCTLVFAKLDRMARDIEFTFRIRNTGVSIYFCDMPEVNTLILGVMASVAEYEAERGSVRTKEALAAKRKRGEALGGDTECWAKKAEHCKNMSDDERKEYRTVICRAAGVANGERKSESARANVHNVAFLHFCQDWAQIHGEIRGRGTDWAKMSEVLNERGLKTAKGLDFNPQRAAAMFKKINETTFNNN